MKTTGIITLLGICTAFALALPSIANENAKASDIAEARAKTMAERKARIEEMKAKRTAMEAKRTEMEAKRAEAKANAEKRKDEQEAKRAAAKAAAEKKKDDGESKKEAAKAKKDEKAGDLSTKANAVTEKRQDRQENRIEQGIKKGYLTPAEISKLNQEQANIEKMQQQFNSDGKVSKDEAKQLHSVLNDASNDIWLQKHDTDGKQMPTYRFGKDVFLKPEVASRLQNENLNGADARKFLSDFRTLTTLKQKLNGDLSSSDRAKLQAQYNDLLGQYFTTAK